MDCRYFISESMHVEVVPVLAFISIMFPGCRMWRNNFIDFFITVWVVCKCTLTCPDTLMLIQPASVE
eukprot:3854946-Prorocentrum_lima.AAC.1